MNFAFVRAKTAGYLTTAMRRTYGLTLLFFRINGEKKQQQTICFSLELITCRINGELKRKKKKKNNGCYGETYFDACARHPPQRGLGFLKRIPFDVVWGTAHVGIV